jgi:hypothetical protein
VRTGTRFFVQDHDNTKPDPSRMKISDIVGQDPWKFAPADPVVGFDIGSRGSKGVLLTPDSIYTTFIPTGLYTPIH